MRCAIPAEDREDIMSDIERRIRRIEDRWALEDLNVRYLIASDDNDTATIAATFAQDAEFFASGVLCGRTRDGIVRFIGEKRGTMGLSVHALQSALFEFADDDHASGIVSVQLDVAQDGQAYTGALRYYDDYVREDGAWRFKRRDMLTVYLATRDEIGTAFPSDTPARWPGQKPAPSDFPRRKG
jgi:hypothetical protein